MWKRVKIVLAWLYDQFIYPLVESLAASDYHDTANARRNARSKCMTRTMYDGTGNDAKFIHDNFPSADLIAIYTTGSSGIKWTADERALFPSAKFVTIDQGGNGSPDPSAMVRDVEPGAWSARDAVHHTPWNAERKTIYCDRADLPSVIAEGWRGDVWLAWPGYGGSAAPHEPGVNVVAVQDRFESADDHSTVYDSTWPHLAVPPPPLHTMSLTITGRRFDAAWPIAVGADHYAVVYVPDGGATEFIIAHPPQPTGGGAVHLNNALIPMANPGTVTAYAIINSKRIPAGSVHLS